MPAYNLFGIGQQSKSPNLTAQKRVNLYLDIQAQADKTNVAAVGTPGLNLLSNPSGEITRGMHWMEQNDTLYVVQRDNLIAVQNNGSFATVATFPASTPADLTSRVSMANNGAQICIVTGTHGYIFNINTSALTNITSTMLYAADSVTFLAGRFIVNRINTGQFFISGLYDGLTWGALDYATAESSPDDLQAVVADAGMLVLFGTSSTEIWTPFADTAFPFIRINAAPSEGGLAAKWSLSKCAGQLTGLFRNRHGSLVIAQLIGYVLTPISTPDIDFLIRDYVSPEDAVGFGYTMNGRQFYQITFRSQGASWLYEASSGAWSQLKSYGFSRHLGDIGTGFGTKFIVSDYRNGQLYLLDSNATTDNGAPIEREITGSHSFSKALSSVTIRRLRIDIEGGVGTATGQGSAPKAMLRISRDGGHTFGNELWVNLGAIGKYKTRAEWRRLGAARDWVFNIKISDPVKVIIIGAVVEGQELES